MKVLLFTYKDISWIVKPYLKLHKKFFNMPITLIADDDYSKGEVDFLQPPFDDKYENFCKILMWTLHEIPDKYIIIMLSDYFIKYKVDMKVIYTLKKYMDREKNILRSQLGNNSGIHETAIHTDNYQGIKILEHNFLETSLTPGLWDRKKLINILKGTNAWNMEKETHLAFKKSKYRSISIYREPLKYFNVLRGKDNENLVITKTLFKQVKNLLPLNHKYELSLYPMAKKKPKPKEKISVIKIEKRVPERRWYKSGTYKRLLPPEE